MSCHPRKFKRNDLSKPLDATLLYACVLEAQQTGDQEQMVISLQCVLKKYDYSAPNEVHLPALLRYAIDTL